MKRVIITICILAVTTLLLSQGPPPGMMDGTVPSQEEDVLPKVIELKYFNIDNLNKIYNYNDSTLTSDFHNYDPARFGLTEYTHLGNQGSTAAPYRFDVDPYIGFNSGYKQYDLYNFSREDFRFLEGNVPMVNARFTPMQSQNDFVFTADYSRTFDDGISVASNYQRIYQTGLYQSQATKITNLGVSLKYTDSSKRYTGFLSMISNVAQEDNNGGIVDPEELGDVGIGNRELLDVVLSGANTRHQQKYYSLVNYYKINNTNSKTDVMLRYDIGFDNRYYKYSDPETTTSLDSSHYMSFITDDRGVRRYTRINKINNAFYAYLTKGDKLNVRAGVVYDRYDISEDIEESGYDNVYLDFQGKIPFFKSLQLDIRAQLGIGDGAGDFNIDGSLALNIKNVGTLRTGISIYNQTPTLQARRLYLTQVPIWNNDDNFSNIVGTKLYGELTIPKLNVKAEIQQHLITNAIYFDALAMPDQSDEIYSASSIALSNSISYWILNLENKFLLQFMNTNLYGLPSYWSAHNFYLEFPMFRKNLQSRWGIETRFALDYNGPNYSPVVGTFHQSTEQALLYPMTDVYFSGKVQKFRIFIKLENLLQVIDNTRVDYRIPFHPTQDWRVRFGVSWMFLG